MVVIHGGSWQTRYGKPVMRALAGDLVRRGWAVWNIEYRRLGDGRRLARDLRGRGRWRSTI